MNLSVHKTEWIRNSKIYRNDKEQMRITAFFSNDDEKSNIDNDNFV
jgi:hypothetical protein